LLLSVFLLGTVYFGADVSNRKLLEFIAIFCTVVMFIGAVLFVFGGLMRPVQKSFYHYALEGNDRYRRQLADNPIALWLWIDSEGRDRDA